MRESAWDFILIDVTSFCEKAWNGVPSMDGVFVPQGWSRCKSSGYEFASLPRRDILYYHWYVALRV